MTPIADERLTRCKVIVNVCYVVRCRIARMMMNTELLASVQCVRCFEIYVEDDPIEMKLLMVQILVYDRRTTRDGRHCYWYWDREMKQLCLFSKLTWCLDATDLLFLIVLELSLPLHSMYKNYRQYICQDTKESVLDRWRNMVLTGRILH